MERWDGDLVRCRRTRTCEPKIPRLVSAPNIKCLELHEMISGGCLVEDPVRDSLDEVICTGCPRTIQKGREGQTGL